MMFAAIQFRLCLSLVPVMLSIPLAWKVHETKMLKAIHDQEVNSKYFFEELEALDETSDNSFTIGDVIRSTTFDDRVMDHDGIDSENETNRVDKIKQDVSLLNEDMSDSNHFLGINFGMSKTFPDRNIYSVSKHQSWVCTKLQEMQNIVKLFARQIHDFARAQLDRRCVALHLVGILVLYFFRPKLSSCCIYGLRILVFPFKICFRVLHAFGLCLRNLVHRLSSRRRNKQKPSASFDINYSTLPRSLSNIKDPESISPSRASFGDVCDQAAMFDEKKNFKGLEERKDADASEWLESSFIEGGIQTYTMFENESSRSTNKTEDYLQFSSIKNTERDDTDVVIKEPPKSSTPRRLPIFSDVTRTQKHNSDISINFSPQKLRKYLYSKSEQKKGLELALGLSKLTYSQCIVVNEQKKLKSNDHNSMKLNYFVNSTKDKIRKRLMNMSYV